MIRSYGDSATANLVAGKISAKSRRIPADIRTRALEKIILIDTATSINDLRIPSGNHLEALTGKFIGFHSIRINQQWRIVFRWTDLGVEDVQIVDYH